MKKNTLKKIKSKNEPDATELPALISGLNKMILNAAGEGIFGVDLNGRHTFVNPAAADMLGYKTDELIGQPSHTLWHHSKADGSVYPEEECPVYMAFKDGKIHQADDEVFWRKNGTSFPVEYISSPIIEDDKILGAVVSFNDITDRKDDEKERDRLISELKRAWDEVKILSGLLPICAYCKNIRDDQGYWKKLEVFIRAHSEADFTHGICPQCAKKHHPDLYDDSDFE